MLIDLYIGSDIGLWALKQTPISSINKVYVANNESCTNEINEVKLFCFNNKIILSDLSKHTTVCDFAFSVHFKEKIPFSIISKYKAIYNIHPGALPYGRGMYPAFWALYKNEPAGVTIHEINEKIDNGAIVEQIILKYNSRTTGKELHSKIRKNEMLLYKKYLRKVLNNEQINSKPQMVGGSYYSLNDFKNLGEIPLSIWEYGKSSSMNSL
jgi:methionyl-tRNA formyltransferase